MPAWMVPGRDGTDETSCTRRWLAANAIETPKLMREIRFGSLMEQLPNPNNRITPAWDHLDAIGLPRPRIAFTVGPYVRDGMAAAKVLHERLFTELRATERNHSDIAFGAGHLIGTTAMGANPATSVAAMAGRTTCRTCSWWELGVPDRGRRTRR